MPFSKVRLVWLTLKTLACKVVERLHVAVSVRALFRLRTKVVAMRMVEVELKV